MHEYEFRLVVQAGTPFEPFLTMFGNRLNKQLVLYAKPHFRFRDNYWEVKRIIDTKMAYHDRTWFKWIHSKEIPFKDWKSSTCLQFLHNTGNFQNAFRVEYRHSLTLDAEAKIYTFQHSTDAYRLVFEWEYGSFPNPKKSFNYKLLLESLSRYRSVYGMMQQRFTSPPYVLKESIIRKPVTSIPLVPSSTCDRYLYAYKLDGTFGLVYSYANVVKERWEDYERVVRQDVSLGDGFVFAAEKLDNGTVVLLDVYQVRGFDTVAWCRKAILLDFLPQLSLPENYAIQIYSLDKAMLPSPSCRTDGWIVHDILKDTIFKVKPYRSIDVVYYKGYFLLPESRIRSSESLEDGCVYEISTEDGSVIRKRVDRFKGNTQEQLDRELQMGWGGPKFERIPKNAKKQKHTN